MNKNDEILERIQKELLDEEETISLDDILEDEELNALLNEKPVPAFEDPEQICEPEGEMQYNNYANGYGESEQEEEDQEEQEKKRDKVLIGLMITASVLCLGILGILIYWLAVLL